MAGSTGPATSGSGESAAADPTAGSSAGGGSPSADVAALFPSGTPELVGKPAPTFDLPQRSGERLSLEALRGRVVVVNFWATWCPPCIEELPSLERLRKQLKDLPVEIVGVSVDDTWKPVDELLVKRPVRFRLALDPSKAVPTAYGTSKFPETFIVDKQGTVVRKLIGAQIWDRGDFVAQLRELSRK